MKADLVIRNGRIYTDGAFFDGGIAAKDGVTVCVAKNDMLPDGADVIDAKGMLVLPGIVDSHVHVRDPGHRERGTFATESRAAAAGGVTCFMEHPISSPPPYSPEILRNRIKVAAPQSCVDYAFFGAAGSDYPEEVEKVAKEGIVAFKTFLHEPPEGREEEFRGLTMGDDGAILEGFEAVARTGKIIVIHAENNDIIQRLIKKFRAEGKVGFGFHEKSRPAISEVETVEKLIRFAKYTGTRICIAHVSTPESMELIKKAKFEGLEIYAETCPQYLLLCDEHACKIGPFAKWNPPLRDRASMEKLWDYVNDGTVDFIGSDHGPFLLHEKEKGLKDIFAAAAGSAPIELLLPLMYTAVRDGKLKLERMIELICERTPRIMNFFPRKGRIAVGSDADYVIVDTETPFIVDHKELITHAKDITTVCDGMKLYGKAVSTVVRGRAVMRDRVLDDKSEGWGKVIFPVDYERR